MTATTSISETTAGPTRRDGRTIAAGIGYLAVGVVMVLLAMGIEAGTRSRLRLNFGGEYVQLPDLVLPSAGFLYLVAAVAGGLGGYQLARGFPSRRLPTIIVVSLGILAFLVWAAKGADFSLVGMLQTTVQRATPLALGALAGVLCERSGVVNIAIEGMMLAAAFGSVLVTSITGSLWTGLVVGGVMTAMLMARMHGSLSITYKVDQIISGTFINLFVAGLTAYLLNSVMAQNPRLNVGGTFPLWDLPVLSRLPILGPVLFNQNVFVYMMFIAVFGLTWLLFHTRWGLRTRAVGEHPKAADTVGVNVTRLRMWNVVAGGAMAGLAGSYLTLGSVGEFDANMSAGRGFIALAALIFGRWHPVGALGAALLFGFTEALQVKLAILNTGVPSQVLIAAPYIVTLFAVAGFVGRSRPPAAVGQPYEKG